MVQTVLTGPAGADGADGNDAAVVWTEFLETSEVVLSSSLAKVGIGTNTPDAKLDVRGQVKITGGSPGAGKVLTSDETGKATWEEPSGGEVQAPWLKWKMYIVPPSEVSAHNTLWIPLDLPDNAVVVSMTLTYDIPAGMTFQEERVEIEDRHIYAQGVTTSMGNTRILIGYIEM